MKFTYRHKLDASGLIHLSVNSFKLKNQKKWMDLFPLRISLTLLEPINLQLCKKQAALSAAIGQAYWMSIKDKIMIGLANHAYILRKKTCKKSHSLQRKLNKLRTEWVPDLQDWAVYLLQSAAFKIALTLSCTWSLFHKKEKAHC